MDKFISWLTYTFYRLICVFFTAFFTGIIAGVYAFVVNKIDGIPYEYGVLNLPIGFYVILAIGSCVGIYFVLHEKRHDLSWLND